MYNIKVQCIILKYTSVYKCINCIPGNIIVLLVFKEVTSTPINSYRPFKGSGMPQCTEENVNLKEPKQSI